MTDLKAFVRSLNSAWREARFDDLRTHFDDGIVMFAPTAGVTMTGADAMIDSYRQFDAAGTIHAFDIGEIDVHQFDDLAMCHMTFTVDYEVESGRFQEQGVEIYAVDTSGKSPKVLWRSQLSSPVEQPET